MSIGMRARCSIAITAAKSLTATSVPSAASVLRWGEWGGTPSRRILPFCGDWTPLAHLYARPIAGSSRLFGARLYQRSSPGVVSARQDAGHCLSLHGDLRIVVPSGK